MTEPRITQLNHLETNKNEHWTYCCVIRFKKGMILEDKISRIIKCHPTLVSFSGDRPQKMGIKDCFVFYKKIMLGFRYLRINIYSGLLKKFSKHEPKLVHFGQILKCQVLKSLPLWSGSLQYEALNYCF